MTCYTTAEMVCVLEQFPGVGIDIRSITEHELYEHWRAETGSRRLDCRYEELTDIQEDRIVRLVINGKQVIPADASGSEDTEQ